MAGGHKIVNQNHMHFITPTVVGWLDIFSRKVYRDIIIDSLKYCQKEKGLVVYAYVIMTNHLHLVVSAKDGFVLSDIIRDFKKFTAKAIIRHINTHNIESRREWMMRIFKYHAKFNKRNTTYQLWTQYNHPTELISPKWFGQKVNYIHQNPVKAGFVDEAQEWIYSSARNYLGMKGIIDIELVDFY
ncbi:MAG: REP element-mobilizing transposase RayT [Halioglobus sp.]|jgi:REP element-mobilizing transposase RayT